MLIISVRPSIFKLIIENLGKGWRRLIKLQRREEMTSPVASLSLNENLSDLTDMQISQ